MIDEQAKQEILAAIQEAARVPASIRVLPTMPKFRYVYTCPRCGCHVYRQFQIGPVPGSHRIRVCAMCGIRKHDDDHRGGAAEQQLRHGFGGWSLLRPRRGW